MDHLLLEIRNLIFQNILRVFHTVPVPLLANLRIFLCTIRSAYKRLTD